MQEQLWNGARWLDAYVLVGVYGPEADADWGPLGEELVKSSRRPGCLRAALRRNRADCGSEPEGWRWEATTAVHLARWLQRRGRSVHLADLDPQQSSRFWLQAAHQFAIPFTVVPADADAALELLPPLAAACDALVVDGPAGLSDAPRAVMLLAVLVLTPAHPVGADLRSATEMQRLVARPD